MVLEEFALLSSKANQIINSKQLSGAALCSEFKQKAIDIVACKSVQELSLKEYGSAVDIDIQEDSTKICYLPLDDYKVHLRSKKLGDLSNDKMDIDVSQDCDKVSNANDLLINDSAGLKLNNGVSDSINHKDSGFYTDGDSAPHSLQNTLDDCKFEDFVEFRSVEEITNVCSESTFILNDNSSGNKSEVPLYNYTYDEYRNVDVYEEIEENNENYFSIKTITISSVVKTASFSRAESQEQNDPPNIYDKTLNEHNSNPSVNNVNKLIDVSPYTDQETYADEIENGKQQEIPLISIDDEESNILIENDGISAADDLIQISNTYSLDDDTQDWTLEPYLGNLASEVEDPTSKISNENDQNKEVISKDDFFRSISLRPSLESQNIDEERQNFDTDATELSPHIDNANLPNFHDELSMNNGKVALPSSFGDPNNGNGFFKGTSSKTINKRVTVKPQDIPVSESSPKINFEIQIENSELIPSKPNSNNLPSFNNKRRQNKNKPDVSKVVYNTRSRSPSEDKGHCRDYKQKKAQKVVFEENHSNKQQTKMKSQTKTSFVRDRHLRIEKAQKEKITRSRTVKNKKGNTGSRRFGYSLSLPSVEERAKTREERVQRIQERREKMERQREERIRLQEEKRMKKFEHHEELLREKIKQAKNNRRGRKAAAPNLKVSEEISELDRTYLVAKKPELVDSSPVQGISRTVVKSTSNDKTKYRNQKVLAKLDNSDPSNGEENLISCGDLNKKREDEQRVKSPYFRHRRPLRPVKRFSPEFGHPRKHNFNFQKIKGPQNTMKDKSQIKPRTPQNCNSKQIVENKKYPGRPLKKKRQSNLPLKQPQLTSNSEEKSSPLTLGPLVSPYDDMKLKMRASVVLKRLDEAAILAATSPYNTPKNKTQNLLLCDPKLSILKPIVLLKDISPQVLPKISKNNSKKQGQHFRNNKTNSMKNTLPDCNPKKNLIVIEDDDNYEMSDFSEDNSDDPDAVPPKKKKIPMWALGVYLKRALIHQHYMPPAEDEIFGTFDANHEVDLVEMFSIDKPYYHRRTSSATWSNNICAK